MLGFAIVRAIEIFGEAASRVSREARALAPEVPWAVIIATRNRLTATLCGRRLLGKFLRCRQLCSRSCRKTEPCPAPGRHSRVRSMASSSRTTSRSRWPTTSPCATARRSPIGRRCSTPMASTGKAASSTSTRRASSRPTTTPRSRSARRACCSPRTSTSPTRDSSRTSAGCDSWASSE
jgi:hypothetical protein